MRSLAILNGFGRFGLHLFAYWLSRYEDSNFDICAVNDEVLSVDQMFNALISDRYVRISETWEISREDNQFIFRQGTKDVVINFSQLQLRDFVKEGNAILFECSGRYTSVDKFPNLQGIEKVYISATSLTADQTLIVGYNENTMRKESKFLSYGSCTVNAFVPLAAKIHERFRVAESDVAVIHNTPEYQLRMNPEIFERRACTLAFMGPKLLPFLNADNFNVNYTVVPITGTSRMDLRFQLQEKCSMIDFISVIEDIRGGWSSNNLYKCHDSDMGASASLLSPYSLEIILDQSRIAGRNLYLSGYFDTENSVNRYFDLVAYTIGAKP